MSNAEIQFYDQQLKKRHGGNWDHELTEAEMDTARIIMIDSNLDLLAALDRDIQAALDKIDRMQASYNRSLAA